MIAGKAAGDMLAAFFNARILTVYGRHGRRLYRHRPRVKNQNADALAALLMIIRPQKLTKRRRRIAGKGNHDRRVKIEIRPK